MYYTTFFAQEEIEIAQLLLEMPQKLLPFRHSGRRLWTESRLNQDY